jgi:hypothetical protein
MGIISRFTTAGLQSGLGYGSQPTFFSGLVTKSPQRNASLCSLIPLIHNPRKRLLGALQQDRLSSVRGLFLIRRAGFET